MHKFRVFFWGLICHVHEGEVEGLAQYAALVTTAETHVPRIVFDGTGDEHVLSGHVTFAHGRDFAKIDGKTFNKYVPKLKKVIRGQARVTSGVAIRCEYPEAAAGAPKLSVVDGYAWTATHRLKPNNIVKRSKEPVGRIIELSCETEQEQITVVYQSGGNEYRRPVDSDGCILITNTEYPHLRDAATRLARAGALLRSGGGIGIADAGEQLEAAARSITAAAKSSATDVLNHFEYYTDLLANADRAVAEPAEKPGKPPLTFPQDCQWVLDYVDGHAPFVIGGVKPECGNSTFP